MLLDGLGALISGALVLAWGVLDLRRPDLIDRYAKYRGGVPTRGRGRTQLGWFLTIMGAVFMGIGLVFALLAAR